MILHFKNKQIEKIAEDVGLYIEVKNTKVSSSEVEFFAEQIIKECANIMVDKYGQSAADTLLNSFGINQQ